MAGENAFRDVNKVPGLLAVTSAGGMVRIGGTPNGKLKTLSYDFALAVDRGDVPGYGRFAFGGNILDLSSGDGVRDIWAGSGNRTVLDGATTLFLSSTNAGDDATIAVLGMDDNYNDIVAIGVLNGDNQVQISADIWKVHGMVTIGVGGTKNGTVYLAESDDLTGGVPDTDSKVQLVSQAGFGFGAIANRTVPVGFTAFISTLKITPNKGKDVTAYLAFESATQDRAINPAGFELFEYNFDTKFDPYFSIFEKTDFMFLAKTTDAEAPVSVLVEGYLVDNNY